jgi:hypothetical protein
MRSYGGGEAFVDGMVDMLRAKDEGLDDGVPRTAENPTPTTFRQWRKDVLAPARAGLTGQHVPGPDMSSPCRPTLSLDTPFSETIRIDLTSQLTYASPVHSRNISRHASGPRS